MRILGLDPGSSATGYGLIESRAGTLRPLVFGIISPPRGLPFLQRLPYIASALEELLRDHPPDVAADQHSDATDSRDEQRGQRLRGCQR